MKNSKSTSNRSQVKKNSLERESQTAESSSLQDLAATYEQKLS